MHVCMHVCTFPSNNPCGRDVICPKLSDGNQGISGGSLIDPGGGVINSHRFNSKFVELAIGEDFYILVSLFFHSISVFF